MARFLIALAAAALTGCSSLGGAVTAVRPAPLPQVDYLNDDLSGLVVAVDLPDGVQVAADGIGLSYDVALGGAPAPLEATLLRGDAEAVVGAMPAPRAGRSYHVFVLPAAAGEKLHELQAFARDHPQRPVPLVRFVPRLCVTGPLDKARTSYALNLVLPGQGAVAPPIAEESLAALEARATPVPACSG